MFESLIYLLFPVLNLVLLIVYRRRIYTFSGLNSPLPNLCFFQFTMVILDRTSCVAQIEGNVGTYGYQPSIRAGLTFVSSSVAVCWAILFSPFDIEPGGRPYSQ